MSESTTAGIGILAGRAVAEVMLRSPKTLPATCTLAAVREGFLDDHVHLALLIDADGVLRGTLSHEDLHTDPNSTPGSLPALGMSVLNGRTIDPDMDAELARRALLDSAERRRAVVDAHGRLLGLLCLKRSGLGFCSDADVAERVAGDGDPRAQA